MKGHSAAAAAPRHRGHNDATHRPCTAKGTQPNFQLPFGQEKIAALDLHPWQHGQGPPAPHTAASHTDSRSRGRSRQPHQIQPPPTKRTAHLPGAASVRLRYRSRTSPPPSPAPARRGHHRTPEDAAAPGRCLPSPSWPSSQRRDHLGQAAPPPPSPRRRLQEPKPERHEPPLQLLAEHRHTATTPAMRRHTGRDPCAARVTPHPRAKGDRRGAPNPPAATAGVGGGGGQGSSWRRGSRG